MVKTQTKIKLENLVCEDFYILNKPMQELVEKYNVTIRVIRHLAENGFKRLYPLEKLNRRRENKYTPEMLDKGVELYKTGKLNFTKIAQEISQLFNVPVSTDGFRKAIYAHTDFRNPKDNKGGGILKEKYDRKEIDLKIQSIRSNTKEITAIAKIAKDLKIPRHQVLRSIERTGTFLTEEQFLMTLPNKHTWGELLDVVEKAKFKLPIHGEREDIIPSLNVEMEFICHCKQPKIYEASKFMWQPLASCGCIPVGTSKGEKDVMEYIRSILGSDPEIINKTKELIPRNQFTRAKEIDIWIPSKNLAIEYNGLYHHSDALEKEYQPGETKLGFNKHSYKFAKLEEKGITFFGIFADEWENKQDLVKAMIRWRLNAFNGTHIRASNCELMKLKNSESETFFNRYHLQGWIPGFSYTLGLKYNGELVSALAIRKNNNEEWEIARFANNYNYNVRGGFSKLLKNVNERPLISFSDNQFSVGNIYSKNGFNLVPDGGGRNYWYTDGKIRISRWRCQRNNDPEILAKYPTEKLQALNGVFSKTIFGDERALYKIDGYGTKKWILNKP